MCALPVHQSYKILQDGSEPKQCMPRLSRWRVKDRGKGNRRSACKTIAERCTYRLRSLQQQQRHMRDTLVCKSAIKDALRNSERPLMDAMPLRICARAGFHSYAVPLCVWYTQGGGNLNIIAVVNFNGPPPQPAMRNRDSVQFLVEGVCGMRRVSWVARIFRC